MVDGLSPSALIAALPLTGHISVVKTTNAIQFLVAVNAGNFLTQGGADIFLDFLMPLNQYFADILTGSCLPATS